MRTAALLAVSAIFVTGCGDSGSDSSGSDSTATTVQSETSSAIADLTGSIKGSGASFPDAFYQEAIAGLADVAPDLTVTYEAIGSSSGREQFAQDLNDFAGSDSLVKDDEGIDPDSFSYIPTTAASIAVVYNLPGVDELQLDGPTVAKIFERKITSWDDPAITALNEGVDLPSTEITVARRADGSGTTKNFTKYLESAAPDDWTLGSDDTVEWPADTQGGQQNPGVAQIVTDTEGGIGYLDYGNAKELGVSMASIQNSEGNFIAPSIEGTQAALESAELADDLTYDPLNGPGADSYPITAPTYILVHTSYSDATKGEAVVGFVKWLITDGADSYAADLGYAPLPESFREKAIAALDAVQVG
ncbi:MAG: phosphate ABC transporter substrate-binding protein PstS [Actinobacteria bacterium]|nr:phosphate ABC transporter substrate-binding protein PstS [Actinomycetota bacterium]